MRERAVRPHSAYSPILREKKDEPSGKAGGGDVLRECDVPIRVLVIVIHHHQEAISEFVPQHVRKDALCVYVCVCVCVRARARMRAHERAVHASERFWNESLN